MLLESSSRRVQLYEDKYVSYVSYAEYYAGYVVYVGSYVDNYVFKVPSVQEMPPRVCTLRVGLEGKTPQVPG